MVMKLFADMERRRQKLDQRDQEERKRKRETEIEEEERVKADREWQQNFEESRQSRVNSWHDFQSGAGKSKKTKKQKHMTGMMVPPKFKPETRWNSIHKRSMCPRRVVLHTYIFTFL